MFPLVSSNFFYFHSFEAITTVQRVTLVTYNPVNIHSNAMNCAKQVVSPASCLQCHKGCGKIPTYENRESILLGQKVCASYVTSRQQIMKSLNQYVYQKLWSVNLMVLGLLSWSARLSGEGLKEFFLYCGIYILFWRNLLFPSLG